jgi:hypothetical protein
MKNLFAVGMMALFLSFVAMGVGPSAHAQKEPDTDTVEGLGAMLKDANDTIREMKDVDAKIETLHQDWLKVKPTYDAHQAKGDCVYQPGHPEQCEGFVQEAHDLDKEIRSINERLKDCETRKKTLKSHLGIVLAKIRISNLLRGCDCSGRTTQEALVACYQKFWDNTYDPGHTINGPRQGDTKFFGN